jgi:hypothetical protein
VISIRETGELMPIVHCEYKDCENNENKMCIAAAVRISIQDCCLTYHPLETPTNGNSSQRGDRLLWDREYIEDDPLDSDLNF